MRAAEGHRLELPVMIALTYGMQRGEVLGLQWSAVDWETSAVAVTLGVKRIRNGTAHRPPARGWCWRA